MAIAEDYAKHYGATGARRTRGLAAKIQAAGIDPNLIAALMEDLVDTIKCAVAPGNRSPGGLARRVTEAGLGALNGIPLEDWHGCGVMTVAIEPPHPPNQPAVHEEQR